MFLMLSVAMSAVLVNRTRDSLMWLLNSALPYFISADTIRCVKAFLSDRNSEQMEALLSVIRSHDPPRALLQTCTFHLFGPNLDEAGGRGIPDERPPRINYRALFKAGCQRIAYELETEAEAQHQRHVLLEFISWLRGSSNITPYVEEKLRLFVETFPSHWVHWALFARLHTATIDETTTSRSEST